MSDRPPLMCIGCGKSPADIEEYVEAAAEDPLRCNGDADEYAWLEEGTMNRANGHFACTPCYIKMGMPTAGSRKRWVAP